MSQNGESPYETKTENLRAVASLSPTLVHVWGTKDVVGTDLTLEDLITKRVKMRFGAMPAGKGSYFVSRQMFQLWELKIWTVFQNGVPAFITQKAQT